VRRKKAIGFDIFEPAIVAALKLSIRPYRQAIRSAAGLSDNGCAAIGAHARDLALRDLHQYDAAIGHDHRSFGEAKPICDQFKLSHIFSLLYARLSHIHPVID
jgi:hypothetical protein